MFRFTEQLPHLSLWEHGKKRPNASPCLQESSAQIGKEAAQPMKKALPQNHDYCY